MSKLFSSLLLGGACVALVAGCGTRRNPAFCCTSEAECAEVGLPYPSECQPGLFCEATECVAPTCSRPSDCADPATPLCVDGVCRACDSSNDDGCDAAMPVCDASSDQCTTCSGDEDCASHEGTPICSASGSCVACEMSTDCANPTPVCDANQCRACTVDSECASGACADDGGCVDDAALVFLSPGGSDAGSCTRAQPCKSVEYALDQTTTTRAHVLFAPGTYVPIGGDFAPSLTNRVLTLHGYGATLESRFPLTAEGRSVFFISGGTLTIKGLSFTHTVDANGSALRCVSGGRLRLQDVAIATPYANLRFNNCEVVVQRSALKLTGTRGPNALFMESGQLLVERSTIGDGGLRSDAGSVQLTNNLITKHGLSFGSTTGIVEFNTVVDTTLASGAARSAECESAAPDRVELVHNVIWSPSNTAPVMVSGCRTRDNLIGPVAQPGAGNNNEDPQFVQPGTNFHLQNTSPAVDKASVGPAVDFDGDPRPSGASFDYGYDEAR